MLYSPLDAYEGRSEIAARTNPGKNRASPLKLRLGGLGSNSGWIKGKPEAKVSLPKQRSHSLRVSMSSIKRDVKKKVLPRPEAEKIFVSRSSPLTVSAPPADFAGGVLLWLVCPSRGFIFRW